jgi:hypothetical protein
MDEQLQERLEQLKTVKFTVPEQTWEQRKPEICQKFEKFATVMEQNVTEPAILERISTIRKKLQ